MLDPSAVTEQVTVRTCTGAGANGPVHAAAVATLCQHDGARRLVRDAGGAEVISETTIRLAPETDYDLDLEALFTPESIVTVRGRTSRVITAKPHLDVGDLVYLEVALI